jgi:hypothetical protein
MSLSHTIQDELLALGCNSLAAGLPLPYKAPAGYFSELPETMITILSGDQPALLSAPLLKTMPYKVPDQYFQGLADHITEKTLAVPSLQQYPQQVPAGYFDTLADQVLTRVKNETPVVTLLPRKRNWVKYAVAATLTGLVALAGITYFNNSPAKDHETGLAIDTQVSRSLQSVSESDLERMVNTLANETVGEKTAAVVNTVTTAKTETLVAGLLNEVPTSELANFLNEFGEDGDDESFSDIN